jgi:ribosomal protein S18 acetylase RimI-like enzyme
VTEAHFEFVPLDPAKHDRSVFKSGEESLDRYLKHQATQDIKRKVAFCYVAATPDSRIAGFYTVSASSVLLDELPPLVAKKLPRHPLVPAVLVGRLAVDQEFKGQGLGGALLADALTRAMKSNIAAFAVVVDAINDSASAFYQHHGFIPMPSTSGKLFLPLATVSGV